MDRIYSIGLIADTHGLVRPDVFTALDGVELILHAGDVGGNGILDELSIIAPVLAVAGNTDPPGDPRLPPSRVYDAGGTAIHLSHGHELGSPTPAALFAAYAEPIIIYGHTHKPLITRERSETELHPTDQSSGVVCRIDVRRSRQRWAINPGAAGPRRFNLRPSVARLTLANGHINVEVVSLAD